MTQDILFDTETGDLRIENGDVVVGDSVQQHINDLMFAEKGFFKFDPEIGIGINRYINDEFDSEELIRAIRLGLEQDGVKVTKLILNNNGTIEIDGEY